MAIKVTNLFTGRESVYDGIDDFRKDAKESYDPSLTRLVDMMSDAYANGLRMDTYEWLIGIRLEEVA